MNKIGYPFIALTLLFLVGCIGDAEVGKKAPVLKVEEDGQSFDVASLKGNYVLVDFWGSWCGPCIREAPALVELYQEFENATFSDAEGFELVSIALEKREGRWEAAAKQLGFTWEHQLAENVSFVRASSYASKYGVTDIPAKFLIGPDGELLISKGSMDEIKTRLKQTRTN